MLKTSERKFTVGETVYVVDCWDIDEEFKAKETEAIILYADEKFEFFVAVLYAEEYKVYSFNDYRRLIFDTPEQAANAARKFPKPKEIVYQRIGKKVYDKMVLRITGQVSEGIYDLFIVLENGKTISTKEIGHSIFLRKSDVKK